MICPHYEPVGALRKQGAGTNKLSICCGNTYLIPPLICQSLIA